MLTPKLQRALNRRNPGHGIRAKVSEKTARDLHKSQRLNDQKRQRPVPKPARTEPDWPEHPRHQIERRCEPRRGPDLVEGFDVIFGGGAHKGAHLLPPFIGIGDGGVAIRVFKGIDAKVFGSAHSLVHQDTSVPSITVLSKSARVMTPTSLPAS